MEKYISFFSLSLFFFERRMYVRDHNIVVYGSVEFRPTTVSPPNIGETLKRLVGHETEFGWTLFTYNLVKKRIRTGQLSFHYTHSLSLSLPLRGWPAMAQGGARVLDPSYHSDPPPNQMLTKHRLSPYRRTLPLISIEGSKSKPMHTSRFTPTSVLIFPSSIMTGLHHHHHLKACFDV